MGAAMNRAVFFDHIRHDPFSGSFTKSQVEGIERLLDVWQDRYKDAITVPQMAYVLATVFHETGARMCPVREGFKTSDKAARDHVMRQHLKNTARYLYALPDPDSGQVYYGRGDVQLTWAENYKLMGERLGVPLYQNPDLALDTVQSARILFEGMVHGLFTGKSLRDYFAAGINDPYNARRIINRMDKAGLIAGYYEGFLKALRAARTGAQPDPVPERVTEAPRYPEELKPLSQSRTIIGSGIAGASTVGGAVVDQMKDSDMAAETIQQTQEALGYTVGIWEWAGIILAVLGLIGVGIVIWSKLQRRKEGRA